MLFRGLTALLALGLLLLFFLPYARGTRASLHFGAEGLFRPTYATIPLRDAGTSPSQAPPNGFAPIGIASGHLQGPWAVRWSHADFVPGMAGPCLLTGTRASGNLVISFAASTVDRVVIEPGLDHASARWAGLDRPGLVDLRFSDGTCFQANLADQFAPQTFDIHARHVTSVTVIVVSAYPPEIAPEDTVAITTIALLRRR
jgi:hypothetical protein